MLKITTGLAPEWFTPESQMEQEDPARFKIKPLDQISFLEVLADCEVKNDVFVPNAKGRKLLLEKGLIDWENITDTNGKPLKFSRFNLAHIPAQILAEICNEIMQKSAISEEQEKN